MKGAQALETILGSNLYCHLSTLWLRANYHESVYFYNVIKHHPFHRVMVKIT